MESRPASNSSQREVDSSCITLSLAIQFIPWRITCALATEVYPASEVAVAAAAGVAGTLLLATCPLGVALAAACSAGAVLVCLLGPARLTVPSSAPEAVGLGRIVLWRCWRHNGAMPSVQIKDVPERTHAVLRQRAAAAHQSLQEYLRARLIEEAEQPTLEEVLDRAGGRSGGSVPLKDAVQALRDDRADR